MPDEPVIDDMDTPVDPVLPCDALANRCGAIGESQCIGAQISDCIYDANNCLVWAPATPCQQGTACDAGVCRPINTCVDVDGDGYGPGCPNGPNDCDDNNPNINPAAIEVCDGVDNNCSGAVDDVPGVGDTCSVGTGACAAAGGRVCGPSGDLVCDATAGQPSAEVCDGTDNDCNGMIDDIPECEPVSPACGADAYEPNETIAAAKPVAVGARFRAKTCSQDLDFYRLEVTAGVTYRVNLAFQHARSDLDLYILKDGVEITRGYTSTDHETVTFTATAGSTYVAEVRNYSGQDNDYRFTLIANSEVCSGDDAFEASHDLHPANYLPPGWTNSGFMCEASLACCKPTNNGRSGDWYYLGMVPGGSRIDVTALFSTSFWLGNRDLDLRLYENRTTSNTFSQVRSAETGGDNEHLTYTVPGPSSESIPYYLKIESSDGYENDYTIRWTRTP